MLFKPDYFFYKKGENINAKCYITDAFIPFCVTSDINFKIKSTEPNLVIEA